MTEKQKEKFRKKAWEYTEAIVTALILALIIRAYVIQAFKIPSGSMIPTLLIGDHILDGIVLLPASIEVDQAVGQVVEGDE